LEVVGVVGDTPNVGLHERPEPLMYVPHTLRLGDVATFLLRTTRDPRTMTETIRRAVEAVDPNQAVEQVISAEEVLDAAGWARERFVTLLLSAFAGFALVLAAIGLYSVVSYSVARRVKEFGIRAALGASGLDIVRLATRSALVALVAGLLGGLMLSLASDSIVARWSIGRLTDAWVLGGTSLVFLLVTALAASLPARRAAATAPIVALRTD
jgi:hypothetical protein